jgi:hypothetical protein
MDFPCAMHPKRKANPNAQRPRVSDKDHDALIKRAWKAGWWARQTGKGKVMCYPPQTKASGVLVPTTPSDHRSIRNLRNQFERRGLKV